MRLFTVAIALSAALALSGCAATTAVSDDSASREAGTRDTRLCIINQTDMNMRVSWTGLSGTAPLEPLGTQCNTDLDMPWQQSAEGVIEYEPVPHPGTWLKWNFRVSNGALDHPSIRVFYYALNQEWGMCPYLDEGGYHTMQSSWMRGRADRLADSANFKEWTLKLTPPAGSDFVEDCT
jgi:hypothetical protein